MKYTKRRAKKLARQLNLAYDNFTAVRWGISTIIALSLLGIYTLIADWQLWTANDSVVGVIVLTGVSVILAFSWLSIVDKRVSGFRQQWHKYRQRRRHGILRTTPTPRQYQMLLDIERLEVERAELAKSVCTDDAAYVELSGKISRHRATYAQLANDPRALADIDSRYELVLAALAARQDELEFARSLPGIIGTLTGGASAASISATLPADVRGRPS
jgi:hypothetical protein